MIPLSSMRIKLPPTFYEKIEPACKTILPLAPINIVVAPYIVGALHFPCGYCAQRVWSNCLSLHQLAHYVWSTFHRTVFLKDNKSGFPQSDNASKLITVAIGDQEKSIHRYIPTTKRQIFLAIHFPIALANSLRNNGCPIQFHSSSNHAVFWPNYAKITCWNVWKCVFQYCVSSLLKQQNKLLRPQQSTLHSYCFGRKNNFPV